VKYLIGIEPTETGYSAYSPDIPSCVSTGSTPEETEVNMREAIEFHIDGLRQDGELIPTPSTSSMYVEIPATKPSHPDTIQQAFLTWLR
jgi:predicted RNase H-like HicB family nuclease